MDADPSIDAIVAPVTVAHHYLREQARRFKNDLPYELTATRARPGSFQDFQGQPINVPTSSSVARIGRNPHLRVRIEYGYYDRATPDAAEDMVAHLRLPDEAFGRIEHAYFPTGHMPYLHEETRVARGRRASPASSPAH